MKPYRNLFVFILAFFLLPFMMGCAEKKAQELDAEDIHFAEFYSDYLLLSGVSSRTGEELKADLDSGTLASLLARHSLSVEQLLKKSEAYQADPILWQKVLVRVRENIRNSQNPPK
ncbi:MAG: hypothetical protein HQ516_01995 [Chlorobium sp.]|nr:hypothetical protein [Chlorobium phaeovibrioides]NQU45808.1 hypothetical protein [Chlorobium sp.]